MREKLYSSLADGLMGRRLPEGGFATQADGTYRVDATAWAVIALNSRTSGADYIDAARRQLVADQHKDGRISISLSHPEAVWPTSLAVLAWLNAPAFLQFQSSAVHFLLSNQGQHPWVWPTDVSADNPNLKGWPWVSGTYSWVEPTAMAILALKSTGMGGQAQVREAVDMLVDRQLPRGGWNYGNTVVFDQELAPTPEDTGIALNALRGQVAKEKIQPSLDYLQMHLGRWRTPRALGWALLGLGAWEERPAQALDWIAECLAKQNRYGAYDTPALALLLIALLSPGGIQEVF